MDESSDRDAFPQEPTVLDWFKSLLRLRPIPIPDEPAPEKVEPKPKRPPKPPQVEPPDLAIRRAPLHIKERLRSRIDLAKLRLPIAILFALVAQFGLEYGAGGESSSLVFYLLAVVLLGWAFWEGDLPFPDKSSSNGEATEIRVRVRLLLPAAVLSLLTFYISGDNRFHLITLLVWGGALVCMLLSLWEGEIQLRSMMENIRTRLAVSVYNLRIDRWTLLILGSIVFVIYFRFAHLASVPAEMWSDHAEKLLDVVDVYNGEYSIFFPRNTGREPIQFYLATIVANLLGTGFSFLTLKISSALIGILVLPYIYLFARELGGREAGLAALLLAGVAYWPNVISRLGLRFPLYPLFTAPALYHLARGLKDKRRNHVLMAGLFAGLALYGYSPARILPFALAVGVGIYVLHSEARGYRSAVLGWLAAALLVVLVVFLPLLRVALQVPDIFFNRMLTRIGFPDLPLGQALTIFLSNVWRGIKMFGWDNGEIWVISVPHRPALDWITGAFFHLGVALVAARYIKRRSWLDLFLLLVIPVLMLPSTLSIAYPGENPAPNRAAGAMVPVFTMAALPVAIIPSWVRAQWKNVRAYTVSLALIGALFLMSARLNYRLVMHDFLEQNRLGVWNTTEVGQVVQGFAESIGAYDTAHVVPFPYWLDTRLVGIIAGKPTKDYALWPEDFESLRSEQRAQMFILNQQDTQSLDSLRTIFPWGTASRWNSQYENKDFLLYFVPSKIDMQQDLTPEAEQ